MNKKNKLVIYDVAIIGAGFSGLSAALELTKSDKKIIVFDASSGAGGLAGSFGVGKNKLEKFYHHWFTSDLFITELIKELNLTDKLRVLGTNTGMYFSNNIYRLSTPLDLLKFTPLPFLDRLRLGIMVLYARLIKDWKKLEGETAKDWIIKYAGRNVFEKVWKPLLVGKFGNYSSRISAVWFWNKIKLRGGSRGRRGEERLMYIDGGFSVVVNALVNKIRSIGGIIKLHHEVIKLSKVSSGWKISTTKGIFYSRFVISTVAPPLLAKFLKDNKSNVLLQLTKINYLANICLVLQLNKPLSSMYWLNINDTKFPFVGIIEHTNFISASNYSGRHIVYISKYLLQKSNIYSMNKHEFFNYAFPYIQKMFPKFNKKLIIKYDIWKSPWAQPVVEKNYMKKIPNDELVSGLFLCTMAHIYPEDRGTNYAIREGKKIATKLNAILSKR